MDFQFYARPKLPAIRQLEALVGVDAQREEVEVEQGLVAVPNRGMLVAGYDSPFAVRLDELGQPEVEIHEPMAGRVRP
jgi:hypothetical protein